MANKLSKDISGSVQEKRGMLYLVVSYRIAFVTYSLMHPQPSCL